MGHPVTDIVGKRAASSNEYFRGREGMKTGRAEAVKALRYSLDSVRLRVRDDAAEIPKKQRLHACPALFTGQEKDRVANPLPYVLERGFDPARRKTMQRVRQLVFDENGEAVVEVEKALRLLSHDYYGRVLEEVDTGVPSPSIGADSSGPPLPGQGRLDDQLGRHDEQLEALKRKAARVDAIEEQLKEQQQLMDLLIEKLEED